MANVKRANFRQRDDGFEVSVPSGTLNVGGGSLAPMDLMLVAVGGCTALDVLSILKKMRYDFHMEVSVEGKRRDEHPKIYTDITIIYEIKGKVPEKALLRAVSLSLNKYCSATAMVIGKTRIHYVVKLNGKEVKRGEKKHLES
ncbi:MAG: OsmC family protein [Thermotogae bacterium]|nr:OsmC family protein [Thermotogota bacterium]